MLRTTMRGAFVIQFADKAGFPEHFSGRAEHIQSGEVLHFQSEQELLDFFRIRQQEEEGKETGEPSLP
jgi:hypothetical protein